MAVNRKKGPLTIALHTREQRKHWLTGKTALFFIVGGGLEALQTDRVPETLKKRVRFWKKGAVERYPVSEETPIKLGQKNTFDPPIFIWNAY